jgi:MFS family permease
MQVEERTGGVNHPLAFRMGLIAFLTQSISFGCMFGSFGVLLESVERKLGIGREASTLAFPLVTLGSTLLAPLVGMLASKFSLKHLMLFGTVMVSAGYALLGATQYYPAYLAAYGLLIGPGMCFSGQVPPSILVTRWFTHKRGRALGFVHMPIMIALLPVLVAFVLRDYGANAVYFCLAALIAVTLIPISLIVDFPPTVRDPSGEDQAAEAAVDPGLTSGQLLKDVRFWVLTFATAAILSGQVMIVTHLVPMAKGWGVGDTTAATLLSLNSFAGIAGTLLFGWLADKWGGRNVLIVACLDSIVLWVILLFHPAIPILGTVVVLIGLHGAAALPMFGVAISEAFGKASFGRAFGLGTLGALPFSVGAPPVAAAVFVRTGSYADAIAIHLGLFALGVMLVALFAAKPARMSSQPA